MKKLNIYEEGVYYNSYLGTYGSAMKVPALWLKLSLFVLAVLPLGTAWMFVLIPRIKGCIIRYGNKDN